MDDGEIVSQSCDRTNGHSVRNEHYGQAKLACGEIERDSVRIAVAGHQGEIEIAAPEYFYVAHVEAHKLDYSKHFEKLVSSMEPAHYFEYPSRAALSGQRGQDRGIGHKTKLQLIPTYLGRQWKKGFDRSALIT